MMPCDARGATLGDDDDHDVPAVALTLLVDDHGPAVEFYCRTLGCFTVRVDVPAGDGRRYVELQHVRCAFRLVPLRLDIPELTPFVGKQAGGTAWLPLATFPSPDFDAAVKRLRGTGAPVEVFELPYGRQLRTRDPFGNVVYLSDDARPRPS
jgi:hypothetical protein